MYLMISTRTQMSLAKSKVNICMFDLVNVHWKAVKFLKSLKVTKNVSLLFDVNLHNEKSLIDYVDNDYGQALVWLKFTNSICLHS